MHMHSYHGGYPTISHIGFTISHSYFLVTSEKYKYSLKKCATAMSCIFLIEKCNCTFYEKDATDAYFLGWLRNNNFSGACYLANPLYIWSGRWKRRHWH
jgi:hypothetical protein